MISILMALSSLLILFSVLPFVQNQHWVFRVAEFIKIQLLALQLIVVTATFFYVGANPVLWFFQAPQLILVGYHVYLLMRYTKFWRTSHHEITGAASDSVRVITCNVYQFNHAYDRFINLVRKEKPDIFLTIESNADWEKSLRVLEDEYPNHQKVTLENTYGMHFYTQLKVHNVYTHYFVSDDLPSIEAELETKDGVRFIFFGVHPPPPSPTEEDNSKERDGDLLSVAKKVRDYKLPVVVTGDFNNVAWAKSSLLFKKTSRLIDARIGRGILSTFHAKYWFFRVPIDLLFHSSNVIINQLLIYPDIGSDHFPLGCSFHIDHHTNEQKDEIQDLASDEKQEVEELIEEGKAEESDNR